MSSAPARSDPAPDRLIWIFGHPRSGSSWLARMLSDMPGFKLWNEPLVGSLFADFYTRHSGELRGRSFFLAPAHRSVWLRGVRDFVLDGARARAARLPPDGNVVIQEPHGSHGAAILSEALPESRMILLVRDPRDSVASGLDAQLPTSWTKQTPNKRRMAAAGVATMAELARRRRAGPDPVADPDGFVRYRAGELVRFVAGAAEGFERHPGPRSLVRYEDLRAEPQAELGRVLAEIGVTVDGDAVRAAVAGRAWESIPDDEKGPGKKYRKATPGGWREDLTPAQAAIVEEVAGSVLERFYSG